MKKNQSSQMNSDVELTVSSRLVDDLSQEVLRVANIASGLLSTSKEDAYNATKTQRKAIGLTDEAAKSVEFAYAAAIAFNSCGNDPEKKEHKAIYDAQLSIANSKLGEAKECIAIFKNMAKKPDQFASHAAALAAYGAAWQNLQAAAQTQKTDAPNVSSETKNSDADQES